MVVESEQFLSSVDDFPDHGSYLIRGIEWPPSMRVQAHCANIFHLFAREGIYLDAHKVVEISLFLGQSRIPSCDVTGKTYHRSMFYYGRDALAHVCLPFEYQFYLEIRNIETISALANAIEQKSLVKVDHIGKIAKQRIISLYSQWQELQLGN